MTTVDDAPLGQCPPLVRVLCRVETQAADGAWWRATSPTMDVAEALRWRDDRRRRLPLLRHEVVEETVTVVRRIVDGAPR